MAPLQTCDDSQVSQAGINPRTRHITYQQVAISFISTLATGIVSSGTCCNELQNVRFRCRPVVGMLRREKSTCAMTDESKCSRTTTSAWYVMDRVQMIRYTEPLESWRRMRIGQRVPVSCCGVRRGVDQELLEASTRGDQCFMDRA